MKYFRLIFFLLITSTIQGQSLCPISTSDIKVCPNTNGQLTASGADFYTWTPSAGLSDTTIANPIVKVATSTTFFVTGYTESSNNLIKNGDFTNGNNFFATDYKFTNTDLVPEGNYTVGINPKTYHTSFSTCKDHTSGSGNMLIVNGIPVSNSTIWEQTITIKPNQDYAFYAYVTPVSPLNPPVLQFSINGKVLGTPFVTPVGTCNWNKFYSIWNSGPITTAIIRIVNQNIIANGNDFAIDDIKYVELCKVTNAVSVNVGPLSSNTNIAICSSAFPYNWNGVNYPVSGTYSTHITSTIGCDSVATLVLTEKLPTVSSTSVSICSSAFPFIWNATSYPVAGSYTKTLINKAGCDSVATLVLTEKKSSSSIHQKTICLKELPYSWENFTFTTAGTQTKNLTNEALCDSTASYTLTVNNPSSSTHNQTICLNELPFTWDGRTFTQQETYVKTKDINGIQLMNVVGCDSTATYNLTVNPIPTITNTPLAQTVCSGTSTLLVNLTSDVASTTFDWTASTDTAITGFTPNGTNIIPAQTLSNPSNSVAGTVTYIITPKANGCTGTAVNYVVTVNPEPITSTIYHK